MSAWQTDVLAAWQDADPFTLAVLIGGAIALLILPVTQWVILRIRRARVRRFLRRVSQL